MTEKHVLGSVFTRDDGRSEIPASVGYISAMIHVEDGIGVKATVTTNGVSLWLTTPGHCLGAPESRRWKFIGHFTMADFGPED